MWIWVLDGVGVAGVAEVHFRFHGFELISIKNIRQTNLVCLNSLKPLTNLKTFFHTKSHHPSSSRPWGFNHRNLCSSSIEFVINYLLINLI